MKGVWVGASLKANELCNDTVNEITQKQLDATVQQNKCLYINLASLFFIF